MSRGLQARCPTRSANEDTSSAPVTGDTYVNSIAVPLLLSKQYRIVRATLTYTCFSGDIHLELPGPKSGIAVLCSRRMGARHIVTATSGPPFSVTFGGGVMCSNRFNGFDDYPTYSGM